MTRASDNQHSFRVVANHNTSIVVQDEKGTAQRCVARKKLGTLVAGDWVEVEKQSTGPGAIVSIAPRSSVLERPSRRGDLKPVAANLTRLVIVSAIRPGIDTLLIDSYCCAAERAGIEPVLLINKSDLLDRVQLASVTDMLDGYRRIGYRSQLISARQVDSVDELNPLLRDQTSVLVGQSGTGKSSIVNRILPDKSIRTAVLSQATGLGGHTTTATTLYNLECGGCLIDSPGVRGFALGQIAQTTLAHTFREFADHSVKCRFHNCIHKNEPGCAVQQAVADHHITTGRYRSYLALLELND